jgi:hypothetical protein
MDIYRRILSPLRLPIPPPWGSRILVSSEG